MIKLFNFKDNSLRTVDVGGEAWFVLKDVCDVLGLSNPRMVKERLSKDVSSTYPLQTAGGMQDTMVINEDGLYDVILESRKPEARAFRKWVTSEVLPTIRKKGMYATDELLNDPDLLIQVATQLKLEREEKKRLQEQIKLDAPKVEFFDAVADSKDAIDIGTAAKVLNINGMGRNKLFYELRKLKVLMHNNQPYQQYVDRGYFRVIENKYTKPDGSTNISIKTLVYQSGLDFIRKIVTK